jgi:hypothetical protein
MATGRVRRVAGRGAAASLLAALATVAGAFVLAPGASAATTVPVHIRDLTPPLVSINAGDSVAFDDQIQDKTVQVGGGAGLLPSTITVLVHTDVTLGIPDNQPQNQHVLKPGDQPFVQRFDQSCLTCTITYTYRAEVPGGTLAGTALDAATSQAVALLPQTQVVTVDNQQTTVRIGVPTPFIVNTLVPLPNLPGVNVPQLPTVQVPVPTLPAAPELPGVNAPTGTSFVTTTTTTTTRSGIAGQQYSYLNGLGAPAMAPQPGGTRAFDPSSIGSAAAAGPGQPGLADASASSTVQRSSSSPLSVPALAAVVALAGAATARARVHQLSRRGARR